MGEARPQVAHWVEASLSLVFHRDLEVHPRARLLLQQMPSQVVVPKALHDEPDRVINRIVQTTGDGLVIGVVGLLHDAIRKGLLRIDRVIDQ